jgi:hypothetical protein
VDFVRVRGRDDVDVIECKWDAGAFDRDSVEAFRGYYPKGHNYLITPSAEPAYARRYG